MSNSRVYREDSPAGEWCIEFRGKKLGMTFADEAQANAALNALQLAFEPKGKYTWMQEALDKAIKGDVHYWVFVQNDQWQIEMDLDDGPPIAIQGHPEAVRIVSAGYPKDWVWREDWRNTNPNLHQLSVKSACEHLMILDGMIQKLHNQANLNMLDVTTGMIEERAKLVFTNRAYFDADEIMRLMKVGRHKERDE